jgi:predicted outer membrane protein
MLEIKQEIATESFASAERELDGKSAYEFDACFMGMQLAAHRHMIDTLKVLERHASTELKSVLTKGRETAQHHFDEAREIMEVLSGDSVETAQAENPIDTE